MFDIKFAFTFTNSEYTTVYFAVLVTSVSMKSFISNCLVKVGCVVSVVFSSICFKMIFFPLVHKCTALYYFPFRGWLLFATKKYQLRVYLVFFKYLFIVLQSWYVRHGIEN